MGPFKFTGEVLDMQRKPIRDGRLEVLTSVEIEAKATGLQAQDEALMVWDSTIQQAKFWSGTEFITWGGENAFTNQKAQDAVGGILQDSPTINFTYTSGTAIVAAAVSQHSIVSDASGLMLSGDLAAPGSSKYYGTNEDGTKGWFSLPQNTPASYLFEKSVVEASGTVSLANDSSAPGLLKYYGTNVSGTKGWFALPNSGKSFSFPMSVKEASSAITLDGDLATPGNSKYYGTNAGGTKGWFSLPTAASLPSYEQSLVNTSGVVTLVNDSSAPGNSKYYGTNVSGLKGWFDLPGAGTTQIYGTSTATLELSGTGTEADPLLGTVLISASADNAVVARPDGLFVANTIQTGVVYGGIVTWISGYTYEVSASGYYINGLFYTSAKTTITLAAPDGSFNRIDTFILDINGVASVLQGTPSSNPAQAPIDVETQLELTIALVETGTTQPTIATECIYRENTEWTVTTVSPSFNPNSGALPYEGLKSIEVTGALPTNKIVLTRPLGAFQPVQSYTILSFQLRPKSDWQNTSTGPVKMVFRNAGTAVGKTLTINSGKYGFDSSVLAYQNLSIPLKDFGLNNNSQVDSFEISTFTQFFATVGFYVDNICFQGATAPPAPTPTTGVTSVNATISGALTVTGGPITSTGTLAFTWQGSAAQYVAGDGTLTAFPTLATQYTDEMAQDAVAAALSDSSSVTFSYNDAANTIEAAVVDAYVRGLLSAGTGISYDNATGVISSTISPYTDTEARAALTLTTSGTSGAATYDSATGVLNIPQYAGGGTTIADGDKGDITVSSSGTVWTVNNTAITYAKLQNVTSQRLLGRYAATDGSTQEISIGAGLALDNATGVLSNTITNNNQLTNGAGYLVANTAITGATKTKITYDSNGLVTAGADATTTDIAEGTNLYYTDSRARGSISLTTTGTSGAATYDNTTGVLNIPQYSGGGGATYTFSTGLTNTSDTITANLSTGITGGQSAIGGIGASENLTLSSTSHATKGKIFLGSGSAFDEVNNWMGIGTTSKSIASRWEVINSSSTSSVMLYVSNIQTAVNSGDTGDGVMSLGYELNAVSTASELVTRVFSFGSVNKLTGGGTIQNMRCFNMALGGILGSTTQDMDAIYIEKAGIASGNVTNFRGVRVKNQQGTNQTAFSADGLTGTNYAYVLLGQGNIPSGKYGIYQVTSTDINHFAGSMRFAKYGIGAVTGTAAKWLAVDSNGNVIEQSPPSGISSVSPVGSAPNANAATITGSSLILQPASSSFPGVLTTGTQSIAGRKTFDAGIVGSSSSGVTSIVGINSSNGNGGFFSSVSGVASGHSINPTSTNSVAEILRVIRTSSGTPANGIGGSIDFWVASAGTSTGLISNSLVSKWVEVTEASRTSQFEVWGINSTINARKLALAGSGQMTLDAYTSSTAFTGTAVANLAVDASGNVITVAAGGGGATADLQAVTDVGAATTNRITASGGIDAYNGDLSTSYAGFFSVVGGQTAKTESINNTNGDGAWVHVFHSNTANAGGYIRLRTTTGDGNYSHWLDVNHDYIEVQNVGSGATILKLTNLPVYDSESAAVTGGLGSGTVYRTSTGELRVKL